MHHNFLAFSEKYVIIGRELLEKSSGAIAQLVEQMTFNHWVQGSSPCGPTNKKQNRICGFYFLRQGRRTRGFDTIVDENKLSAVRVLRVEGAPLRHIICDGWGCAIPVAPPKFKPTKSRFNF